MARRPSAEGYDAFISYSHSADKTFAPALKQALHRFTKPWYKLRALHVFVDDSNLPCDSDLAAAIDKSLDSTRYFILLASQDYAKSPWCTREAIYWLEHKPHEAFLIALTSGEIAWDEASGDFDWAVTDAIPRELSGMLAAEPRWTDFRWAKDEEHMTLAARSIQSRRCRYRGSDPRKTQGRTTRRGREAAQTDCASGRGRSRCSRRVAVLGGGIRGLRGQPAERGPKSGEARAFQAARGSGRREEGKQARSVATAGSRSSQSARYG